MYKFDRHRSRRSRIVKARTKNQIHQSSNFFSTLVAVAALLVSVASAGASAWQALLVHEQLTASDRNRSFQELVQQAGNICELFFPNKIKTYSYAAQADGTSIIAVAREDIDPSIYSAELAEKIAAESRKLRLAFTVAGLWSTGDQARRFSRAEFSIMELFQYFSSPDLSVSYYRDFFAMRYINASYACTNDRGVTLSASVAGLVNDEGTWWLEPDSKPDQVVVAPQANLERIDREQIRQLAKQQTELLKSYDSYNQI
ncbi:MAG: hypothetical protein E5X93_28125 [Mesorhizobium sp.]|uniref:hypothetical protein n=1 Tax=Mesorhizobium sp. TaxID=1871066 RepID=UPI001216EB35|nr:hypothetical protein [Mesorhizobium sp.]TIO11400.1 MAG: hypothetical protein E5X93_28125 [Mesorhizobium sp.]